MIHSPPPPSAHGIGHRYGQHGGLLHFEQHGYAVAGDIGLSTARAALSAPVRLRGEWDHRAIRRHLAGAGSSMGHHDHRRMLASGVAHDRMLGAACGEQRHFRAQQSDNFTLLNNITQRHTLKVTRTPRCWAARTTRAQSRSAGAPSSLTARGDRRLPLRKAWRTPVVLAINTTGTANLSGNISGTGGLVQAVPENHPHRQQYLYG